MENIRTAHLVPGRPPGRSWLKQAMTPPETLHITGYDHEAGTVVIPSGDLDIAGAPLLSEYLDNLASGLPPRVVADLANLNFCDCAGLSVLLRAHYRYARSGGWLRLSGPNPTIHKTLRITDLISVLVCYPSIAAAFLDPAVRPRTSPGGPDD
jgi:anti-sigma B factor antagonist